MFFNYLIAGESSTKITELSLPRVVSWTDPPALAGVRAFEGPGLGDAGVGDPPALFLFFASLGATGLGDPP